MTAAPLPFSMPWLRGRAPAAEVAARTDPPAARPRMPVLIQDAVTPFGGETLLLFRMRAELAARLGEAAD